MYGLRIQKQDNIQHLIILLEPVLRKLKTIYIKKVISSGEVIRMRHLRDFQFYEEEKKQRSKFYHKSQLFSSSLKPSKGRPATKHSMKSREIPNIQNSKVRMKSCVGNIFGNATRKQQRLMELYNVMIPRQRALMELRQNMRFLFRAAVCAVIGSQKFKNAAITLQQFRTKKRIFRLKQPKILDSHDLLSSEVQSVQTVTKNNLPSESEKKMTIINQFSEIQLETFKSPYVRSKLDNLFLKSKSNKSVSNYVMSKLPMLDLSTKQKLHFKRERFFSNRESEKSSAYRLENTKLLQKILRHRQQQL